MGYRCIQTIRILMFFFFSNRSIFLSFCNCNMLPSVLENIHGILGFHFFKQPNIAVYSLLLTVIGITGGSPDCAWCLSLDQRMHYENNQGPKIRHIEPINCSYVITVFERVSLFFVCFGVIMSKSS